MIRCLCAPVFVCVCDAGLVYAGVCE